MPVNNFKAFASDPAANVITQSAYEALTALIADGFATGTAESSQVNKVVRQSSIMAAVLAQLISDQTGQDSIDDGTTTTLLANLKTIITPPGTLISYTGTVAPPGYLPCPSSVTNVSRTTYANLFAAIGTTWGAGDGVTTFGIPYFAPGYVPVQGTPGALTHGALLSHTHSPPAGGTGFLYFQAGYGATYVTPGNTMNPVVNNTTSATGGANNLAAGMGVLICVKY